MGIAVRDIVLRDPFGLGGATLSKLNIFNQYSDYTIYDQHIFSKDMNTLLMFIEPAGTSSASSENEKLIDAIESTFSELEAASGNTLIADYYGGAGMAVYNARQIKKDTTLTLALALVIIFIFIMLVFRKLKALYLIFIPVIFGAIFALGLISLIKGQISIIAIGGGAAIMEIGRAHV